MRRTWVCCTCYYSKRCRFLNKVSEESSHKLSKNQLRISFATVQTPHEKEVVLQQWKLRNTRQFKMAYTLVCNLIELRDEICPKTCKSSLFYSAFLQVFWDNFRRSLPACADNWSPVCQNRCQREWPVASRQTSDSSIPSPITTHRDDTTSYYFSIKSPKCDVRRDPLSNPRGQGGILETGDRASDIWVSSLKISTLSIGPPAHGERHLAPAGSCGHVAWALEYPTMHFMARCSIHFTLLHCGN